MKENHNNEENNIQKEKAKEDDTKEDKAKEDGIKEDKDIKAKIVLEEAVKSGIEHMRENRKKVSNDCIVPAQKEYLIAIDAGHQLHGNNEKEPIGPGASETKAKVAGGTSGCSSGIPEYQLTLEVALKLQVELESRGYKVLMIRTTNDVNISNSERAEMANAAGADVFIRIHANGSEDSSVNGAMTICQTPDNPYNSFLYQKSRNLSENVLSSLVESTGCKKEYVLETDSMSGINWCKVPVTIVEIGYMTNPTEDVLMASDEYQERVVQGISNGIDCFFDEMMN